MPARRRSNKPPKDPNAPKKYQSSYFIYSNERRSPLREQYPQKAVTDISKLISAEWKEISDETKQGYIDKAKVLRAEYEKKMGEYKQTDKYSQFQAKLSEWKSEQKELKQLQQHNNSNSNSNSNSKHKGKGKGKKLPAPKKPKPPADMPKKSQTSYFLFSNERRPSLREQNPKMPLTKIAGLISIEWRAITPEQKTQYEIRAKALKEEYENVMVSYKQTQKYKDYMEKLTQFKAEKKAYDKGILSNPNGIDYKVKLPRKPKDEKCPKKSQSSYFIFAALVRADVKAKNPGLKLTDIAKKISLRWKALSDEERGKYSEQAKVLKEQYLLDLAAYKQTESYTAHQKVLAEYETECKRLHSEARAKAMAAARADKEREERRDRRTHGSSRNKNKNTKKKNRSRYHTDSDDSSSGSGSSSSGSSSSRSSSSGSDSSSGSGSDSESSSSSGSGSSSSSGSN